jgi:hypothetical protein
MRDKLSRGEVDEKEFVQPEISNNFWKNTRDCLHYNNSVELVNERPYDIVVEDDEDRNEVNGITDHTIKIKSCDFHVLTIEDKRIDLVMGPAELGQAKTQMMGELKDMDDSMNYVPEEYCGILQNGVSWMFLFRKLQLGKFMWNYVVAPDTFVDGVIQEDSCRIVTKLVEHVYCVADRIVGDILHPKKRAVLTTSLVDTSNDGNVNIHDDNSGSGSEDYGDKVDAERRGASTHLDNLGAVSSGSKLDGTIGRTNNGNTSIHTNGSDENWILPLTSKNVCNLPTCILK